MEPSTQAIAYYISAHGYGHGVRSCDIIRTFNRLYPRVPVIIVSDLPASFLRNRLESGLNHIRPASFDVGMVQRDSVRVDVKATLERVSDLHARAETLIEDERRFYDEYGVGLVVSDIPALPLEAAARHDVSRLAVGNFAWDWIYSAFEESDARWGEVISRLREGYGQAELLLRLPFSEPMEAFPQQQDIPLVATPGRNRREDVARVTGCDPDKRWILLSFSSLDWDETALRAVESLDDYVFLTVRPLEWKRSNIFPVNREEIAFTDVIASVDAVLTKPGFGILCECVVNRKPMIYVDREDFLEYHILEDAVKRYLKHQHVPAQQLYRGDLRDALDALWGCPEPGETPEWGGAPIAAQRIAEFYYRD